VFVDEAQDCTNLQWECIRKLSKNAHNVIIAGDDDQAIYEWNGANPHGMADFAKYHGLKPQVLNQSYRVPQVIHDWVHQKFLSEISLRVDKEFKAAPRPGGILRYGDLNGFPLTWFHHSGGGMILVRDRFQMRELRQALHHEMIPYEVIGGGSPWTSMTANALRNGDPAKIHPSWIEFYRQWDPTAEVRTTIGTIHQAKGMEADRVVVDLTLSSRTLLGIELNRDAELRVQYVAATRAAKELFLCGSNPLT
jgi:superfamily I DNA/RNA helicase